jgi:hypothetical protein
MEINEFQKRLTDEACLLRGKIIAGYSLVEYVLADISVRLDLKFPYRIKDRIKAVKQIVDRPSTKPIEGSRYRCGRSPDWLKMTNPAAPAVKREAEEDWDKRWR